MSKAGVPYPSWTATLRRLNLRAYATIRRVTGRWGTDRITSDRTPEESNP
jgi:hypothetical protein